MRKIAKLAMTAMTVLLVGGTVSTTASAATWHKGTPKALRGKYQGKRTSSVQGFGPAYTLTAKKFDISESNMPDQLVTHLKYKKIGTHLYRLKGHMAKSGFVLGGNMDYAVYRKGKTFASTGYSYHKKHGFSNYDYAKKVNHFKDGGAILH